jgi:hypothetical protein
VGFAEGVEAEEGAEAAAHGPSALARAYKPSQAPYLISVGAR